MRFLGVGCIALLSASTAHAQYSVPSETSASQRADEGSVRTRATERLVREAGWEVGASLNFVTSKPSLGGEALEFTDLMLLRVHVLVSIGDAELYGGVDILPKQPSYADELVWQGASFGARYRVADRWAVWSRGEVGPMIDSAGYWAGGAGAVQHKRPLQDVLFWESALGWSYVHTIPDTGSAAWVVEVTSATGIAIREPGGRFSSWLMFGYDFPVADARLDSQPRVSLRLGGLIGLSKTVDLFTEWSILDRGDLEDPATTLPILNGGFDQRQLVFGFMRRFDAK